MTWTQSSNSVCVLSYTGVVLSVGWVGTTVTDCDGDLERIGSDSQAEEILPVASGACVFWRCLSPLYLFLWWMVEGHR